MAISTNLKDLTTSRVRLSKQITLTSGGYFAPKSFPGGSITVYPWDSSVDDTVLELQTKKKVTDDQLFIEILPSIVDLNGCPVDNFVSSEVLLLVMVSRSLARENKIELTLKCPYCGTTHKETISVPGQLEEVGKKSSDYPGYDDIVLPVSKDVVRMRPTLVKDEKALLGFKHPDQAQIPGVIAPKTGQIDYESLSPRLRLLSRVILGIGSSPESIGSPDNPLELVQWFKALVPKDTEALYRFNDAIQPRLSNKITFKCDNPKCEKQFDYALDLVDFFRQD